MYHCCMHIVFGCIVVMCDWILVKQHFIWANTEHNHINWSVKSSLLEFQSFLQCDLLNTVMALLFTGQYFHEFHEKSSIS